jgi:hypothetical protein
VKIKNRAHPCCANGYFMSNAEMTRQQHLPFIGQTRRIEMGEFALVFQDVTTHRLARTRLQVDAHGKTRPLTVDDFAEFEKAYVNDPNGGGKRKDEGEEGRWRCFTRDVIKGRNDNLDIAWLRDTEAEAEEQLTEPEDIAAAIIGHLKAAMEDIVRPQ